jgi:3-methylfumaryl-CoA hydratase
MWAGSQLQFHSPILVGDRLRRVSRIDSIEQKSGRSGDLVFVNIRHQLYSNGSTECALTETQNAVYRQAASPSDAPSPPRSAPLTSAWERSWVPDEVLLFRYSALTFNNHRIHYDRPYATGVESYPGLVVHGPLIATLLLDLLRRGLPDAQVTKFEFRAVRPLFDLHAFHVCGEPGTDGRTIRLWAKDHEGWLAMDATAEIR